MHNRDLASPEAEPSGFEEQVKPLRLELRVNGGEKLAYWWGPRNFKEATACSNRSIQC